jgi:hypothetical protein
MPFTRWFGVVNWTWAVAPRRGAARKTPRRKLARPTLWPELLEDRVLPSAGPALSALVVEPGEGTPPPAAFKSQPADPGSAAAPTQAASQGDEGTSGRPSAHQAPPTGTGVNPAFSTTSGASPTTTKLSSAGGDVSVTATQVVANSITTAGGDVSLTNTGDLTANGPIDTTFQDGKGGTGSQIKPSGTIAPTSGPDNITADQLTDKDGGKAVRTGTSEAQLSATGVADGSVSGSEKTFSNITASSNGLAEADTTDRSTAFSGLSRQEQLVQRVYLDALGRAGSKTELDGWVAMLNTSGQQAVADGIGRTTEADNHLVNSWFVTFLGRSASSTEERGLVQSLQTGQTEEQVLSEILGSSEFNSHAQALVSAGTAQQRLVTALYEDLLNRSPSTTELAAGVDNLAKIGAQGFALSVLESQEFRTDQLTGFSRVLLPLPDVAEFSSSAAVTNQEAVGGSGGSQQAQQAVLPVTVSTDQAAAGGENGLGLDIAAAASESPAAANATFAVVSFVSPVVQSPVLPSSIDIPGQEQTIPVGSAEAIAAPAEELAATSTEPVAVHANASSPGLAAVASTGVVTLAGSGGALLGGTGAFANGAPPAAGLSPASLPATNLIQGPLLRQGLLSVEPSLSGTSDPSALSQLLDGDGAFLELWDSDQLLFPDSLPRVEELLFPGGLPRTDEMPLPDRAPNLGGPLSRGEQPVEVPLLAGAVGQAPTLPDGPEAVAAPAPAAGLALSSANANRPEVAPAAQGEDSLRPYQIALGLLPFLPAFGFTPVTLRERVRAGRRLWQDLRRRRPPGW